MSPGRKPSFSPASTAGLARLIRFTSFLRRDDTDIAMARYVFPVPAGPIPMTMSYFFIDLIYSVCAGDFGMISLFFDGRDMASPKDSFSLKLSFLMDCLIRYSISSDCSE